MLILHNIFLPSILSQQTCFQTKKRWLIPCVSSTDDSSLLFTPRTWKKDNFHIDSKAVLSFDNPSWGSICVYSFTESVPFRRQTVNITLFHIKSHLSDTSPCDIKKKCIYRWRLSLKCSFPLFFTWGPWLQPLSYIWKWVMLILSLPNGNFYS